MARRKKQRIRIDGSRPDARGAPQLSLTKKLIFSAGTTIAALGALELAMWIAGVEPAYYREDPYAGFSAHIPHYVAERDADGQMVMAVAPNKTRVLNPQRFTAEKPADVYRIVCLGGSTTYGRPFFDATSFPGWLRALLPAAQPSRRWEVINAGGIAYASYRDAGLMEELSRYAPDLFIVYTGHNEFLERRTYGDLAGPSPLATGALSIVNRTRTATLVRGALDLIGVPRAATYHRAAAVGEEVRYNSVNAIGPKAYHRDDQLAAEVVNHFTATLKRMARIAQDAHADLLFVVPESNLADFTPFKSEHRAGLDVAALARWNQHDVQSRNLAAAKNYESSLREIGQAEKIDDQYAALWYRKGQILQALGRHDESRQAFERARNEDVCQLRAIRPLVETVRKVAAEHEVDIVDFEALVRQASDHGLPGRAMFHDHVHPTIEANRLLALAIVDRLASRGTLRFDADWNQGAIDRVTADVESTIDRSKHAAELRLLASMLARLKQPDQARYQAELSLGLSGKTSGALLDLGTGLREQGAPALAAEYLQQLLEADPKSAKAHCALGMCWLESGREPEGVEELRTALELDPALAEAHGRLGVVMASQGQLKEAEVHFSHAVRLLPESHSAHDNLGLVLARSGRLREAVNHFERALAIAPNSSTVHHHLGQALEQLGQLSAAQVHYEAAFRINPALQNAQPQLRALGSASSAAR